MTSDEKFDKFIVAYNINQSPTAFEAINLYANGNIHPATKKIDLNTSSDEKIVLKVKSKIQETLTTLNNEINSILILMFLLFYPYRNPD